MAGVTRERSPRAELVHGLVWIAVVGVGVATLSTFGPRAVAQLSEWLASNQESLPWFASRLLGLLAYWTLAASVVYGLALSTGILDRLSPRVVSLALHQELSAVAIALTLLHGAMLLLDTFVHTSVLELAVPFATSFAPVWVGLGQIAMYLMVIVYASFYVRRRIGQRAWRLLHYTTLLAFVGATAHGLMAGSDSGSPFVFWSYVAAVALTSFLFVYRIATAITKKEKRA